MADNPSVISANHLAGGLFEPQRESDFLIEIHGIQGGKGTITLSLESSALATESNETVELHFLNEVRYVAGKARYETVPLVVKDFVDVPTRDLLYQWRRQVYNPGPVDRSFGNFVVPVGGIGMARLYKKRADILLFSPSGTHTRVQTLIGVYPEQVVGGTLNMTSSEKVLIEMTLRFDRVEEEFQVTG
jgi:hypothetical protein